MAEVTWSRINFSFRGILIYNGQFRIKERFTNNASNYQLESIIAYLHNILCLQSGYTMKTVQLLLFTEHFRFLKIRQSRKAKPCEIILSKTLKVLCRECIFEKLLVCDNYVIITPKLYPWDNIPDEHRPYPPLLHISVYVYAYISYRG